MRGCWGLAAVMMLAWQPAFAGPPAPTYVVTAPKPPPTRTVRGWGAFATADGRTMDLRAPGRGWADDPSERRDDVEAGYGWRRGHATAVVGYADHDLAPQETSEEARAEAVSGRSSTDTSVIGVSFSYRLR